MVGRRTLALVVSLAVAGAAVAARQAAGPPPEVGTAFESYIEALRLQAGIPAISGALVQDGVIVWERGLGFANVEARVAARPDTAYAIGDLTEALSSVLLLQCVEQRHLLLDAPLRNYGVTAVESNATLRQVLSHTSPTGAFKFDPERFGALTDAVEHCVPQPFRKSMAHRLLEFLAMVDSVPGRDMHLPDAAPEGLFTEAALERYARVLENAAVPYRVDARGRATRTELPATGVNTATGVVSTVRDLARFDAAIDTGKLLRVDTLQQAWSPSSGTGGLQLPTGLGWFVQTYRGAQVVWQFGTLPNAYSALIVKVPSRRATMILLANSDGLAPPGQLDKGDVTRSLFAAVFLRMLL